MPHFQWASLSVVWMTVHDLRLFPAYCVNLFNTMLYATADCAAFLMSEPSGALSAMVQCLASLTNVCSAAYSTGNLFDNFCYEGCGLVVASVTACLSVQSWGQKQT